ncbi:5'-3' exoribonuclease 2-like [Gossypium hirsutum]|uniref:5'-3' exoribonuclease 2-like n=1 Tax=Gossypium hirsutum TaxID=3635 RepID=A0ABM3BEU9_GOSHI|nr:5'-3' exoribonuclease 2-like [Gossypium hirsutum]
MKGLSQVSVKFQKGQPFKPFHQLMSVLPPRSAHVLPKLYAKLITDADSQIIDFYPTNLEIDTDGKRHAWQGICKLPFVDEERLLSETLRLEKELTVRLHFIYRTQFMNLYILYAFNETAFYNIFSRKKLKEMQ